MGTILISFITWCMFVGWIMSDERDGLGARQNTLTQSYFNWHPFLMSSTFFLFLTPAVLSFEVCTCSRATHKKLHGFINTFAIISVICGVYIILDCHQNLHDDPIINPSIHSIAGYMSFSLLCIVYLIGLIFYGIGYGSDEAKKC